MSGKRIDWLDIAKYICIIFVMVHHLEGGSEALYIFYASFFLKAFFFAAGYVYRHTNDFKGFFIKKVKGLFVPWLIFSTFNILLSQVLSFNEHNDLLTEIGWNLLQIRNHGDGIWFVAALFVAFIPFYFLTQWSDKKDKNKGVAAIIISFFLSAGSIAYTNLMDPSLLPWNGTELPWHLEYIFQAMLFMVLGYYFRKRYEVTFDKYNTRINRICLAIVYLLLIYMPYVFQIEFPILIDVIYQYVREFTGVIFLVSICKVLKTNRYISYVGQNTLIYFALHGKVLSALQTAMEKMVPNVYAAVLGNAFSANVFVIILALVISVVLMIPTWIINKFFPFVLGRKNEKGYRGNVGQ